MPQPSDPGGPINVLPRLKENDPFKVLGIPPDSDFEEVQAARNYLVQEYEEHERSREHVERAYERIVSQSFKARQKSGFKPGRLKRGERARITMPPSILQRVTNLRDKSVTAQQLAKDTVPALVFALWFAMAPVVQGAPVVQAPLLLMALLLTWKWQAKRKIKNPDGRFLFDSPVLGAVLSTGLAMAASWMVAGFLAAAVPWYELGIGGHRVQWFLFAIFSSLLNTFVK